MTTHPVATNRGKYIPPGYTEEELDFGMSRKAVIADLFKTTFKDAKTVHSAMAAAFPELSSGNYPHFQADVQSALLRKNHLLPEGAT